MAESARDRVACPACNKQFRWSRKHAGRKVKCPGCEGVFRMPTAAGSAAELLRDPPAAAERSATGYELDAQGSQAGVVLSTGAATNCPSCNSQMAGGAVICLNCGFNVKEGRKIETAVEAGKTRRSRRKAKADKAQAQEAAPEATGPPAPKIGGIYAAAAKGRDLNEQLAQDAQRKQIMHDRYIPIVLVVIGLILMLVNAFLLAPGAMAAVSANIVFGSPPPSSMLAAMSSLAMGAVHFVLQVPLMLVGIIAVAKIFGTSFDVLLTAVLKLAAIALVLVGVDQCVNSALEIVTEGFGGLGGMVSWSVMVTLFFILCMWLLETDFMETAVLYLIVALGPTAVMMWLGAIIMSLFM